MQFCLPWLFAALVALVHPAYGLERDDPRVDGKLVQACVGVLSLHLCIPIYIYTVLYRTDSEVLEAVYQNCCDLSVPPNSS